MGNKHRVKYNQPSFHPAGFSGKAEEVDGRTPELTDPQHSAQSYEVTLGKLLTVKQLSFAAFIKAVAPTGPERGLAEAGQRLTAQPRPFPTHPTSHVCFPPACSTSSSFLLTVSIACNLIKTSL